jgi:hypothetical protein
MTYIRFLFWGSATDGRQAMPPRLSEGVDMNNEEKKRILEYLGWCRPCFDVNSFEPELYGDTDCEICDSFHHFDSNDIREAIDIMEKKIKIPNVDDLNKFEMWCLENKRISNPFYIFRHFFELLSEWLKEGT